MRNGKLKLVWCVSKRVGKPCLFVMEMGVCMRLYFCIYSTSSSQHTMHVCVCVCLESLFKCQL